MDAGVHAALIKQLSNKKIKTFNMDGYGGKARKETLYRTLVVLFVLNEVFGDRKIEWGFLEDKTKAELRDKGIDNPEYLIAMFTLEIKGGGDRQGDIKSL